MGTNFSGCCLGPNMFIVCVTTTGTLYVFLNATHSSSPPAFDAEYGFVELYRSYSSYATPGGAGPNISSVEK